MDRRPEKLRAGNHLKFHFITHIPDADNWKPNEVFTGGGSTYHLVKFKATIEGQDFVGKTPAN